MNIMGRRVLRLMGISVIAIAIPQLALASDSRSGATFKGATFKLAMGPTSAALKNQGPSTTSDTTITNCSLSDGTCAKPHHRYKSKRAISAAQSR